MEDASLLSTLTAIILTPTFPLPSILDYRTVTGVNGPLVILDNVKVKIAEKKGGSHTQNGDVLCGVLILK